MLSLSRMSLDMYIHMPLYVRTSSSQHCIGILTCPVSLTNGSLMSNDIWLKSCRTLRASEG